MKRIITPETLFSCMLTQQLQQLGLTEGEAKVYEALLTVGTSTVGPIVKRAKVAYSNIYEILDRLLEKGLVTYISKERTKYFTAVPPYRLQEFLTKQEDELKRNREMLGSLLPELNRLGRGSGLDAEIFTGMRGITTAYEIMYHQVDVSKEEVLFFYVYDPGYTESAYAFYQKHWPVMKRMGLKCRGIQNIKFHGTEYSKNSPKFLNERFVDLPLPGNIDILSDKVLIITWGLQPIGVLIHSEQVASHFRNYFDAVWKIGKK
jgi:HTH-type transcriptional regulator, sugar sensing transcriptional regulator